MKKNTLSPLHRLVWTALLAALVGVGGFIHFSIGPVPISLQTMFVILAGFILGPLYGAACIGLYLLAGFIGVPVFAGGKSGIGHLFGPTGGYLFGFLTCAALSGLARLPSRPPRIARMIIFGLMGLLSVYAIGLPWLKITLDFTWAKTLGVGFVPFIPGAVIKLALAVAAAKFLFRYRLAPLDHA